VYVEMKKEEKRIWDSFDTIKVVLVTMIFYIIIGVFL